jgi:hypothetical protein
MRIAWVKMLDWPLTVAVEAKAKELPVARPLADLRRKR